MSGLYWWLLAAIIGLGLSASVFTNASWAQRCGIDVWAVPALTRELEDNRLELQRIEEQKQDLQIQVEEKRVLVDWLVAGRITLSDATSRLLGLYQQFPGRIEPLQYASGATSAEKVAQILLRGVQDLSQRRAEAAPSTAKVLAEFRTMFPAAELDLR